jgi:hypothetical protein
MDLTAWIIVGVAVAASPWVALRAYRAGRRTGGRKTMPWRPIFQLVDHRMHCLGHEPARVQAELGARLELPPVAWSELLATRRRLQALPTRPSLRVASGRR